MLSGGVSLLKGTLNNTNDCEALIYQGLSRILNATIHDKIYAVIMRLSTVTCTIRIPYHFIVAITYHTVSFLEVFQS